MKYRFDYESIKKSADYILSKIDYKPDIAIVLGSALGPFAEEVENPTVIPYGDIPNFLQSTAPNHAGELLLGQIEGKNIVCMSGRFHHYEGYDYDELVIPIRVLKLLGAKTVILTNIAGAVNADYVTGDIMIIEDHIRLMGDSPLRGPNMDEFGPRFFDVSDMYTKKLRELAKKCADEVGQTIKEGIYFYYPGPQLETPAEIRACRVLGADAVGMSTVTEALTAAHCGMDMLALSLMVNMAAGILDTPIDDDKVLEVIKGVTQEFVELTRCIIKNINTNV